MDLVKIQNEVKLQLGNQEVMKSLVATTFSSIPQGLIQQAVVEGMMRGFTFKDFLEKNIYAIGYGNKYSLVSSIDYARKIGMRSGVVGKSAPKFVETPGGESIVSCEVTIKRKVGDHIGEFTALVYFSEYSTGKNQWATKPRTMIAKVAEMHALRMACPEEMSQVYAEEELAKEHQAEPTVIDIQSDKEKLEAVKSLAELKEVWATLPVHAKRELEPLKEELKSKYANT